MKIDEKDENKKQIIKELLDRDFNTAIEQIKQKLSKYEKNYYVEKDITYLAKILYSAKVSIHSYYIRNFEEILQQGWSVEDMKLSDVDIPTDLNFTYKVPNGNTFKLTIVPLLSEWQMDKKQFEEFSEIQSKLTTEILIPYLKNKIEKLEKENEELEEKLKQYEEVDC